MFMHGGETGCFTLKDLANNRSKPRKQSSEWDCVKVVLFLVQNLLTKVSILFIVITKLYDLNTNLTVQDVKLVCESAATCFTEIVKYISERAPAGNRYYILHPHT